MITFSTCMVVSAVFAASAMDRQEPKVILAGVWLLFGLVILIWGPK